MASGDGRPWLVVGAGPTVRHMDPIGALAITLVTGICSLFPAAWVVLYPGEVVRFFRNELRDWRRR